MPRTTYSHNPIFLFLGQKILIIKNKGSLLPRKKKLLGSLKFKCYLWMLLLPFKGKMLMGWLKLLWFNQSCLIYVIPCLIPCLIYVNHVLWISAFYIYQVLVWIKKSSLRSFFFFFPSFLTSSELVYPVSNTWALTLIFHYYWWEHLLLSVIIPTFGVGSATA